MISQPEHILGVEKVQDQLMALHYLAHGPDGRAIHDFSVITRDLTRNLGKFSSAILTEIESVLIDEFGTNRSWTEVRPSHVTVHAAQHVASRVFVGAEVSRNGLFHTLLDSWAFAFGYIGLLLRTSVPAALFPIIATSLSYIVTLRKRKVAAILVPAIKQRISQVLEAHQEKQSSEKSDSKHDVLQWLINDAATASDPRLLDPWNITGKVMLFHLFAEHTTAKTSAIVIFDILTYTNASDLLEQLRAEAKEFLPQVHIDPYCTRKMVKLDSAIRESMRLNPMSAHALTREVIPAEGITTPDGLHLPQRCRVAVDVSNMQREVGIDGDGSCFEPFRYYNAAKRDPSAKQRGSTHISEEFLPFSLGKWVLPAPSPLNSSEQLQLTLGRHACPGRFFAVHVLKLMLGYMIMHYDLEPLQTRPKFLQVGDMALPPSEAVIRVRRRVGAVCVRH